MLKRAPPGATSVVVYVDFPRGNGSLDRKSLNWALQSISQLGQVLEGPACLSTYLLGDYP